MNGFYLLADMSASGAFGAAKEAFSGGLSSTAVVTTIFGAIALFLKSYGPKILAMILDAIKTGIQTPSVPTNPNKPTDPNVPAIVTGLNIQVIVTDLLKNLLSEGLGKNMPILRWFLSLPPDKQQEFFTALQERFHAADAK